MARPENLWLSPASLAKVDDDNYRAFIIDKAHLPFPENQSGSKRLIADTMMSVGIEVDPVDITYAPAPGDTRSGHVTIVIVAKITDGAQLNAKKVWTSHPLARSEPVIPGYVNYLKHVILRGRPRVVLTESDGSLGVPGRTAE